MLQELRMGLTVTAAATSGAERVRDCAYMMPGTEEHIYIPGSHLAVRPRPCIDDRQRLWAPQRFNSDLSNDKQRPFGQKGEGGVKIHCLSTHSCMSHYICFWALSPPVPECPGTT